MIYKELYMTMLLSPLAYRHYVTKVTGCYYWLGCMLFLDEAVLREGRDKGEEDWVETHSARDSGLLLLKPMMAGLRNGWYAGGSQ